jgi:YebC/PmpR family DNA-binding regulatory protein
MAGHSKWHNIQHRKGAQDAKRGKIFTKLIKEIIVATKAGGAEIENNPALRMVIDKAYSANMKKDTIENAIKRGSGNANDDNYEEIRYEGYSVAGTAIMVDCLTDNKNRTVAEIRYAFAKHGGNLGTAGSVGYLFTKQGFINFEDVNEDLIIEQALNQGAEDVITNENNSVDVITKVEDYFKIKDNLSKQNFKIASSAISFIPSTRINLSLEDAQKFLKFLTQLEDIDDVKDIYHNADISDEIMAELQSVT